MRSVTLQSAARSRGGGGGGGAGGVVLDLGFSSGSIVKPAGPWDARENSGVTDQAVVNNGLIPGFTNIARFRMHPGSETQPGWGNRELVRMDTVFPKPSVGLELWIAGASIIPSAGNTAGKYNASMWLETFHNLNGVVNSMVAPIGLTVGSALETWNGTNWTSIASTPALVARLTGGFVPNQQPGGSHPGTNPSYWHNNILIPGFAPEPYDIPIWFIQHIICHEYANGSPPGGWNIYGNSPAPAGADTAGGTLEIWIIKKSTRPVAADFAVASPTLAWSPGRGTAVPTLVYGDTNGNGTGSVVHDQPYGPFIGSYDASNTPSVDTISYNSEVDWAGLWLCQDFASAVKALTG